MKKRNDKIHVAFLMAAAALLVVLAVFVAAFLTSGGEDREGIVLPPSEWQITDAQTAAVGDCFVTVSAENVSRIVADLSRPAFYRQTFAKTISQDGRSFTQTMDILCSENVWKVSSESNGQRRHILSDGTTAYLWYAANSPRVESVPLSEDISLDDLSGIPTYETIVSADAKMILEASFVQTSSIGNYPCIYVSLDNGNGTVSNLWVNLDTGVLCKASCTRNEKIVYELTQSGFELFAELTDDFRREFLLPNGSDPFPTAAEEMQPS